jgi:hypothetical protein
MVDHMQHTSKSEFCKALLPEEVEAKGPRKSLKTDCFSGSAYLFCVRFNCWYPCRMVGSHSFPDNLLWCPRLAQNV